MRPLATTARSPAAIPRAIREIASVPQTSGHARVSVRGKFLWAGGEKLYLRGVTYGTFRPRAGGIYFPPPQTVGRDFAAMADNGINAVRTYTPPPHWLLDLAQKHGLRVLAGLQAERHYAFLQDRRAIRAIRSQVTAGVRACAGHPATLGYLIANEIPAAVVRWHGVKAVTKFLKSLSDEAKGQDPEGLISYANYPSTEYLDSSAFDMLCFNVFLEARERYAAYLGRLQNLAGNRPLIITEVGLDSRRNGDAKQAECLDEQIRESFAGGCAGAFVYAWTDEWYRSGEEVHDWDFGLTTRHREPKPALATVRRAFAEAPFSRRSAWPKISILVCTYNGSRTIRDCLAGIANLRYPNFETIVVDDGSTDGAGAVASRLGFRVLRTENRGLSAARNLGWQAASGEIVAYIDDDASPDPDWLFYLASAFQSGDYVGMGGPNLPVPEDGDVAQCVAAAPGGPAHVLLSDREAEHVPGCNMAFRRSWLECIEGFDPQFRQAGDDVDICWRTRERGGRLGFCPAAMVWHHYRATVRAYWKQQVGYGKAEALLERKWPQKYNLGGHATWAGHIYAAGMSRRLPFSRQRIYQGTWGTAGYARLYQSAPSALSTLPLMYEWQLWTLVLAALCAVGVIWPKLLVAFPVALAMFALTLVQPFVASRRLPLPRSPRRTLARVRLALVTATLHWIQPWARLWGQMKLLLTARIEAPLRSKVPVPWPRRFRLWSDRWIDHAAVLLSLESALRADGAVVRRGGDFDRWDLEIRGGLFGGIRLRTVPETFGLGKHMLRLHFCPWFSLTSAGITLLLLTACGWALLDRSPSAGAVLAVLAVAFAALTFRSGAIAVGAIHRGLGQLGFERL